MSITKVARTLLSARYFSSLEESVKRRDYVTFDGKKVALNSSWGTQANQEYAFAAFSPTDVEFTVVTRGWQLWLNFYLTEVECVNLAIVLANKLNSEVKQGVVTLVPNLEGYQLWYSIPLGNLMAPRNLEKKMAAVQYEVALLIPTVDAVLEAGADSLARAQEFLVSDEQAS